MCLQNRVGCGNVRSLRRFGFRHLWDGPPQRWSKHTVLIRCVVMRPRSWSQTLVIFSGSRSDARKGENNAACSNCCWLSDSPGFIDRPCTTCKRDGVRSGAQPGIRKVSRSVPSGTRESHQGQLKRPASDFPNRFKQKRMVDVIKQTFDVKF